MGRLGIWYTISRKEPHFWRIFDSTRVEELPTVDVSKTKTFKTSVFHPFQLNNNTRPRKPRVVAMRRLLPHTMLSLMDSPDFGETYSSSQWLIWLIRMEDYNFTNVEYESWYSQLIRIMRINPTTEQRVNHDTRIPYLPSWMVDVYGKLAGKYAAPPIWVVQRPIKLRTMYMPCYTRPKRLRCKFLGSRDCKHTHMHRM